MSKKANKAEQKKALRSVYLKKRNKIEEAKRQEASEVIRTRLCRSKRLKVAKTVFVYASYKSEVETGRLIQELLRMGKRVAVPKVNGMDMDFYEIQSWEDLFPGYQGILEPQTTGKEPVFPVDSDVMLFPGVVFDRKGGRIGYGGGYYDRYLEKIQQLSGAKPYLMALAFRCQLYPGKVPSEEHDKKLDCILTEKCAIKPRTKKDGKINYWIGEVLEIVLELVLELLVDAID